MDASLTDPDALPVACAKHVPSSDDAAFASLIRREISLRNDKRLARREERLAPRRAEGRELYRQKREAMGETVRPYNRDAGRIAAASGDAKAYKNAANRDRQRARRDVTAISVRSWTNLSELTTEEKLAHKRTQANERKREQRHREAGSIHVAKVTSITKIEQTELDEILAALEM